MRLIAPLRAEKLERKAYGDLLLHGRLAVCSDLFIWLPWLLLAWFLILTPVYPLALVAWFFFFLTGLRQAHEAFHRTMGIPAWLNDWLLVLLSPLMLSCLHATRYAHLRHHRYCLHENDIEGEGARHPAWKAILLGPLYPLRSHIAAFRHGGAYTRRFMLVEFFLILACYATAIFFFPAIALPHLAAMLAGEWLVSFFAVWMVHHDCTAKANPSRTIRGIFRTLVSYHMFYHHEHHAYPVVPTRNLPELARRLDKAGFNTAPRAF